MWAVRVSRQLQVRSGLNAVAVRRYTNPLVNDKAVDDSQAFNKELKKKVEDVRTDTANRAKAAGDRASPDRLAEKTEEAVGSAQRQASHAKENVKEGFEAAKDKAQSYTQTAKEKAGETAQAAKEKTADATEGVRHKAAQAAEDVKHKTNQAAHTAQEEGRGVFEKVKEYAEDAKEKIEKTAQSIKETVVGK